MTAGGLKKLGERADILGSPSQFHHAITIRSDLKYSCRVGKSQRIARMRERWRAHHFEARGGHGGKCALAHPTLCLGIGTNQPSVRSNSCRISVVIRPCGEISSSMMVK